MTFFQNVWNKRGEVYELYSELLKFDFLTNFKKANFYRDAEDNIEVESGLTNRVQRLFRGYVIRKDIWIKRY